MQIRELMTEPVHTISPTSTIREAAEHMREQDVGALPVSEDGKAVGMITDRDIVIRAIGKGQNPTETVVGDVMTAEAVTISEDADLQEAARIMEEKCVRRLLVVSQGGDLRGIVSLGDLAEHCDVKGLPGEILREISAATATA